MGLSSTTTTNMFPQKLFRSSVSKKNNTTSSKTTTTTLEDPATTENNVNNNMTITMNRTKRSTTASTSRFFGRPSHGAGKDSTCGTSSSSNSFSIENNVKYNTYSKNNNDDIIFKGAEILRRQLSSNDNNNNNNNGRSNYRQFPEDPHSSFDRDPNGDEWNPWRSRTTKMSNQSPTSSSLNYSSSNTSTKSSSSRKYDRHDDEDDVGRQRRRRLAQLVPPSTPATMSTASSTSSSHSSQQSPTTSHPHDFYRSQTATKYNNNNNSNTRLRRSPYYVSDDDDNDKNDHDQGYHTINEGDGEDEYGYPLADDQDDEDEDDRRGQPGSYLPTQWLSGLSLSPDNSNNSSSRSNNNNNHNKKKEMNDNDKLETSTLDFLASLHVHDNDDDNNKMDVVGYYDDEDSDAQQGISTTTRNGSNPSHHGVDPFTRIMSPTSPLYCELYKKDLGFRHAVSAGNLWQSLCSQHVRFPALWWDGTSEPTRGPPMGSTKKFPWTYLGRHRVQGDRKLNALIGNRGSSGRLLLHLIVRDAVTGDTIEDICCGCFHPNARGVRTTNNASPQLESCRDIWIAHRRHPRNGDVANAAVHHKRNKHQSQQQEESTIESLLKYQLRQQNEKRVATGGTTMSMDTPLGNAYQRIHNDNLKVVFGSKPPLFTVFVDESELFELFQSSLDGNTPASVVLLRRYLRYRIG